MLSLGRNGHYSAQQFLVELYGILCVLAEQSGIIGLLIVCFFHTINQGAALNGTLALVLFHTRIGSHLLHWHFHFQNHCGLSLSVWFHHCVPLVQNGLHLFSVYLYSILPAPARNAHLELLAYGLPGFHKNLYLSLPGVFCSLAHLDAVAIEAYVCLVAKIKVYVEGIG